MRIVADSHVIAEHVRDWEAENVHYEPVALSGVIGAKAEFARLRQAVRAVEPSPGFAILRRRLESRVGGEGRREFIKVLRLLEKHSPKELGKAIDRALDIGALTVDVIRILLQEGRESPAKIFQLDDRPHLQDHHIPEPHIFTVQPTPESARATTMKKTRNEEHRPAETSSQGTQAADHAR